MNLYTQLTNSWLDARNTFILGIGAIDQTVFVC